MEVIWNSGEYRVVAVDEPEWYWEVTKGFEEETRKHLSEQAERWGCFILHFQKWNPEIGRGWEHEDSVGGCIPSDDYLLLDLAKDHFEIVRESFEDDYYIMTDSCPKCKKAWPKGSEFELCEASKLYKRKGYLNRTCDDCGVITFTFWVDEY